MLMIRALYQCFGGWLSCKWNLRAWIKVNGLEIFELSGSNLGRSQGKDWFFVEGAKEVDEEAMLQGSWCRAKTEANANEEAKKEADLGFNDVEKISSSAQSFWKRVCYNGGLDVTEGGTTEEAGAGGQEKRGNFPFSRSLIACESQSILLLKKTAVFWCSSSSRVNAMVAFSSSSMAQTWAFSRTAQRRSKHSLKAVREIISDFLFLASIMSEGKSHK